MIDQQNQKKRSVHRAQQSSSSRGNGKANGKGYKYPRDEEIEKKFKKDKDVWNKMSEEARTAHARKKGEAYRAKYGDKDNKSNNNKASMSSSQHSQAN